MTEKPMTEQEVEDWIKDAIARPDTNTIIWKNEDPEMSPDIPKLRHRNRITATAPKLGKFWCYACDRQLVSEYGKCPNCGARNGNKRLKKDSN